jgi:hypothetical protein
MKRDGRLKVVEMGSQILKSWGFKLYFGGIEHTWKNLEN